MGLLKRKIKDYPGKPIELKIDNPSIDFAEAKEIEKQNEISFDSLVARFSQTEF